MGSLELVRGLQPQQPFYWKEPVPFKSHSDDTESEAIVCNNRNVRFSNVVTIIGTSDGNDEDAWYSTRECHAFSRQAQLGIRLLQSMEKESANPFFWTKSLGRIYETFRTDDTTRAPSMIILSSNRITIDERFVGLESLCVPSIRDSLQEQKETLVRQIMLLQNNCQTLSNVSAVRMHKASVKDSKASVLFAHYIAKQNARSTFIDNVSRPSLNHE